MNLVTPAQMGQADTMAAASGIVSYGLMLRAGHAVAASVLRHFPERKRVVILCGPGNNGGDGYVAANVLTDAGMPVAVFHVGNPEKLSGDAALAWQACTMSSLPIEQYAPSTGDVVVDALFGAGLSRPLSEMLSALITAINERAAPVVSVDLPSGVCGLRGCVLGAAFQADHTVTFMAPKPGHFLLPGRTLCGRLEVFDIGIPRRILDTVHESLYLNEPALWNQQLPRLDSNTHKFRRGHLGVLSGGAGATGAARLSAMAGLKAGAGLVTLGVPPEAFAETAAQITAIMQRPVTDIGDIEQWLDDKRLSAFVLGPGFGVGEKARAFVNALAARPMVIDADGISSFAKAPDTLFNVLSENPSQTVLTPHEGEFARLFPDIAHDKHAGKVEKAERAARRANAIVLYKGADTVIAAPDGRVVINANAPPWLATAGSGDVLAGIIGGLLAQGMPAFEAACAGAWLHGEAGNRAGEGLTAEDLVSHLPHFSALRSPSAPK